MDTIKTTLGKLSTDFLDSLSITQDNLIFKIGTFAFFVAAFTILFYYLRKTSIISNTLQDTYNDMIYKNMMLNKGGKKLLKKDGFWEKWIKLYTYSRIDKIFTFLTPELWLAIIIVFGLFVFLISLIFIKDFLLNVILGIVAAGLLIFFEMMLSMNNYQKVDKDLIQFLNMLGSYSLTAQEVTATFRKVARFMNDPLRTVLIECYEEARTSGKPEEALNNMTTKIEHPQFHEIIKNLEIAINYDADFTTVVKSNRQILQNYMSSKQERKALASDGMVNMFVMALALIGCVYFMGQLLGIDIWAELFGSLIGQIALIIEVVCFLAMFWKIYTVNKS